MPESVLRLFRCCTKRDIENNYILKSSVTGKLSSKEQLEELVSHELRVLSGNDKQLNTIPSLPVKDDLTSVIAANIFTGSLNTSATLKSIDIMLSPILHTILSEHTSDI